MNHMSIDLAAFDRAIARHQRHSRLPAVAAAVSVDGHPLWQGAAGHLDGRQVPATPQAQFRIGSITKTFVAVLVLRLVQSRLLDLDEPLQEVLPDARLGAEVGDLRIEQVISMGSGMRAETQGPWWERTPGIAWADLEFQLRSWPVARGAFHYSNVGFAILGQVVSEIVGRPWHEVLTEEILQPLGLSRTTLRPEPAHATGLAVHPHADSLLVEPEHDADAMAPAGQLWSTTQDLLRWTASLQGVDGVPRVLEPETVAAMRRPRTFSDVPGQPWTLGYGYGLMVSNIEGRRRYGHGGSMPGFQARWWFELDDANQAGAAVVVLTNSTAAQVDPLVEELFSLAGEERSQVLAAWRAHDHPIDLLDLTGTWYWGPAQYDLALLPGEHLELRPVGRGRGSRFRPVGPDIWEGLDDYFLGEALHVVRRDGHPHHLDLASFRLTRTPYHPDADLPGGPAPWA